MAGKSGRNVTYSVQEEPAFIKRFKEKIGYKEDPGIDEKVLDKFGVLFLYSWLFYNLQFLNWLVLID